MNVRLRASLRGTPRKDQPVLEQVNHGKKPHQDQDQQARADDQDGSPARSVSPGGLSSRASSRSLSSSHYAEPIPRRYLSPNAGESHGYLSDPAMKQECRVRRSGGNRNAPDPARCGDRRDRLAGLGREPVATKSGAEG